MICKERGFWRQIVLDLNPSPTALPNCSILALLLKLILSLSLGFEQLERRNYPYRTKHSIWYLIKVFKQFLHGPGV